ncbi:MAG: hypothetical protein KH319_01280 [Butyricicoccus pullicaecorum]|jgi:hypothetical protein|nr:hypothetical protein [Butyricicoccus pullicaecorum]
MKEIQKVVHRKLTKRQLEGYRQWIAELDEESRKLGGGSESCDSELYRYFAPDQVVGRQVYESFSDEELLDIMIRTMHHQGHKPRCEEIYCVHRWYLKRRFGNLQNAADAARARMNYQEDIARWPADWYERVSLEAARIYLDKRQKKADVSDWQLIDRLYHVAVQCRQPPRLTCAEMQQLDHLGGWKRIFEQMGLPTPRGARLKRLQRGWKQKTEREEA